MILYRRATTNGSPVPYGPRIDAYVLVIWKRFWQSSIQTLQQDIEVQERQIENLEQFIQRVHKYKDLDELTPYALRELVKGVYIEAPDKSSGKRRQNIRISYDLVGVIPLNELMKEETA